MSRIVPTSTFLLAVAKLEEFCAGMSVEDVRNFISQCQTALQLDDACDKRHLYDEINGFDPRVYELRNKPIFLSLPFSVESIVYDVFVRLSDYYDY